MTNPDTLLVFDETVTRAGVEGWLRHLESAGAPTEMYRLGGTVVAFGHRWGPHRHGGPAASCADPAAVADQ